jgi:hypothetical protein
MVCLIGQQLWPVCLLGGFVVTPILIWCMGAECGLTRVILHGDAAWRGTWSTVVTPPSAGKILLWMELPSMSWLKWG